MSFRCEQKACIFCDFGTILSAFFCVFFMSLDFTNQQLLTLSLIQASTENLTFIFDLYITLKSILPSSSLLRGIAIHHVCSLVVLFICLLVYSVICSSWFKYTSNVLCVFEGGECVANAGPYKTFPDDLPDEERAIMRLTWTCLSVGRCTSSAGICRCY